MRTFLCQTLNVFQILAEQSKSGRKYIFKNNIVVSIINHIKSTDRLDMIKLEEKSSP